MKLTITTVVVLVCLCGMKGIHAVDYYGGSSSGSYGGQTGYAGSYGGLGSGYTGSYGGMTGGHSGSYGLSGYGSYSGYGKSGHSGYGTTGHSGYGTQHLSGYGTKHLSGYGSKHYTGYGKSSGHIVEETTYHVPMPMPMPVTMPVAGLGGAQIYGAGVSTGSDGGLFGGNALAPLGLLLFGTLLLRNNNNSG